MNTDYVNPSKIDTVILAGGLGTRLRPVLKDKPKCLATINGKPFIDILLDNLGLTEDDKWWTKLSPEQQAQYIKDHPKSKKAQDAKEKNLFRTQRKAVEAGAHGTLDYTIKEGVNKDKIADEKIIKSKK